MTALAATLSPTEARDPDFAPGLATALPLGIQHVLAMFVSNITPPIIVAGAAGIGFGSRDPSALVYMIQMAMLFAGIATLLQTLGFRVPGFGPVGARLPLVQGTSFAFIPIMIPIAADKGTAGIAALCGGALACGVVHALLSRFVGRVRFALPPMITGSVVLMIGLSLMKIGIEYAAGGVPAIGTPAFGAPQSWLLAGVVVAATLALKFFGRGMWSTASVLLGLIAGYVVALAMGRVDFAPVAQAGWFMVPQPLHFGLTFTATAVIGFVLTGFVSSIETIGDVSAICEGTAGREARDAELVGAVGADGIGTAIAALFGAMPNTTFSQNVGLIAITGVMSRHVVTLGALFLVLCGFVPRVGAVITTIPIEVLGGGVIVMFGMVASSALAMLSEVDWNQRNMLIFGVSLSLALGLQLEPAAVAHVPELWRILLTSGVLPVAFVGIMLNLALPHEVADPATV